MTEVLFGNRHGTFKAVVVNRDDPLKGGRVQLRILGDMDDKTNVPDKDLYWSFPEQTITSAGLNHVGWSPTGVMVGSTVSGYWADKDKTIPIYTGVLARAKVEKPSDSDRKQPKSVDEQSDIAPNARGTQKTGVKGETNFGKDYSDPLKASVITKAENADSAAEDKAIKFKKMKHGDKKTIADVEFKDGQKLLNVIKSVDPENAAGAIKKAVDGMIGLKNLTSISGMLGGIDLSMINQIAQQGPSLSTIQNIISNPSQVNVSSLQNMLPIDPSMVTQITSMIRQVIGGIGQKGGLASFDEQHGIMSALEDHFDKMFKD